MSTELIQSVYSHYIIIGCSIAGLVWGGVNAMFVSDYFTHQPMLRHERYFAYKSKLFRAFDLTSFFSLFSAGQQGGAGRQQNPRQQENASG